MSGEAPRNDRFHQLVGELEVQNEKLNRRVASLCRSFSRCSLVMDGRSEGLDGELERLREALKFPTSEELEDAVSRAADALVARQGQASEVESGNPLAELLQRLAGLDLPAERKRRIVTLRDEFAVAAPDTDRLASEFFDLLRCDAPAAGKGGLLQRLFGSDDGDVDADAEAGVDADARRLLSAALLTLLEQLVLPAELAARAEQIRERLRSKGDAEEWRDIVESVAGLFTEMRSAMDAEIRSFELFLSSLTQRLQGLDQDLGGADWEDDERGGDRRRLDDAVQAEVRELARGVDASKELNQLKALVSERLDTLCVHLEARHKHEEQRAASSRARIDQLTGRLRELENETQVLQSHIHKARDQALRDPLTGIANRLAYNERIVQEYARWKRFDEGLSVIICDIDHFKDINDRFGHKAGDKALTLIAKILSEQVRETDFLARYGGEEFVMLLPGAPMATASGVAEKLRAAVQKAKFHFNKQRITITLSCGIAYYTADDSLEAPLLRADKALYSAKQAGRNRCVQG